jgi:hypothetical protein
MAAWDYSEPITRWDGTVHARETCDCPRCVEDRAIRERVLRAKAIDDLCWLAGTGRYGQ